MKEGEPSQDILLAGLGVGLRALNMWFWILDSEASDSDLDEE